MQLLLLPCRQAGQIKSYIPFSPLCCPQISAAEFLVEHGFVDMIVHRKDLRSEIVRLIDYCGK